MKTTFVQEPELEFGTGKRVDIKFGLMEFAALDYASRSFSREIKIGIVGTETTIEGVQNWFERCRNEVPAKPSNQPNLFPKFPGFNMGTAFYASLLFSDQLNKVIAASDIASIFAAPTAKWSSLLWV